MEKEGKGKREERKTQKRSATYLRKGSKRKEQKNKEVEQKVRSSTAYLGTGSHKKEKGRRT